MLPDPTDFLLTSRRIAIFLFGFVVVVGCLYGLGHLAMALSPVPLGIHRWFPLTYFYPRMPTVVEVATAIGVTVALFALGLPWFRRTNERYRPVVAAVLGVLAILGTTATQGLERGFVYPVAGREPHAGGQQYWHDAQERDIASTTDASLFLRQFNGIQPTLKEHARTHPPGAVLLFAALRTVTGNRPALATGLIAAFAVVLTAYGFSRILDPKRSDSGVILLLLLLPAVQLYYCATIDAIIAGGLLLAIAGMVRGRGMGDVFQSSAALAAVSFLTFGWVWAVPVLLIAEAMPETGTRLRLPVRTIGILIALTAFYIGLHAISGFNYLTAFRTASHLENPQGFRLFADPAAYLATRVEDIAELAFFCGPFVLWGIYRGLPILRQTDLRRFAICLVAVGTLFGLFLMGAYRTGETARACLFLFPFLVLPPGYAPLAEADRETLYRLVFLQALLMQCFGFYFW